ncbi:DUF4301 family protein [Mesonia aquimarina]|uniref:DUF4301 family protein n=1 Tax=Mesonia aquimarina TaxID=1504967 RepID=UPI000EF61DF9|nr:DUF4301 family protein [Mesonia aquimarina]
MKFTEEDQQYITENGLSEEIIAEQLACFKEGIPYANLVEAAVLNNGVFSISEKDKDHFIEYFDSAKKQLAVVKFVPASGAATRMFKLLFEFLEEINEGKYFASLLEQKKYKPVNKFLSSRNQFPFYKQVLAEIENPLENEEVAFLKTLLDENKLNFGQLPKGLIPFHQYQNFSATAFEEHLYESAQYCSINGKTKIHFTVAEHHLDKFKERFDAIQTDLENATQTTFEIDYSFQEKRTNTIAVNLDNTPFRNKHNQLVFRPGGHGALLQNLNKIEADVVFIKNIDNVIPREQLKEIVDYKKILGGFLLQLQEKIFSLLRELESQGFSETLQQRATHLMKKEFGLTLDLNSAEELKKAFHKPIRICGMVKNEGAPGGGPFWIKNEKGETSLQIIEGAQIDQKDATQKAIVDQATHFNPVDVVCGFKDFKGRKFDLNDFVDKSQLFISEKSKHGKKLKALELPGLWNGAMAKWNTVFVEVPSCTFNPVKTVNDLLQPNHQPGNEKS